MTPEEFRHHGHALIDWIADYRAKLSAGGYPAMSPVSPGWLRQRLPHVPPETPEPFDAIRRDLDALIVPAVGHFQHPSYFGYFPTGGSLASALGDFVSTGLGPIGLNWAASPALTELEEVTLDWLRQMVGLSSAWRGVIQDTASVARLVALICARERTSDYAAARGGLQAQSSPLVVYASRTVHSSVEKAALLAGFGRDNARGDADRRRIRYALPEALAARSKRIIAAGRRPCAWSPRPAPPRTTALDPLRAMPRVAQRRTVWLHVDAAMAGSAMILPECRWMWHGVESGRLAGAQSAQMAGRGLRLLALLRARRRTSRSCHVHQSELTCESQADGQVKNYRDWGIAARPAFSRAQTVVPDPRTGRGRAAEALAPRSGERAVAASRSIVRAELAAPGPVPLQTLCVRHEPPGTGGRGARRHTLGWCGRINSSGAAY